MTSKRVVVFDWDGTLINSLEIKIRNAAIVFEQELGIPAEKTQSVYRRFSGIPRIHLFDAICVENGYHPLEPQEYVRLSSKFSELNLSLLANPRAKGLVFDSTRQSLIDLTLSGYPLYISSSAVTEEIHTIARSLELDHFFHQILGCEDEFTKGKAHFAYIQQKEKVGPRQIFFVGDEPTDIRLGQEAGVITIAKVGTHSFEILSSEKPDYLIKSLDELPDLIDSQRFINEKSHQEIR